MAPSPTTPIVTTPAVAPTKPFTFDANIVKSKFKSVRDHLQSFVGRPGYNAFTWMHKYLLPLEERFMKGETSKELFDAVSALKLEEPIAKGAEHNIANKPKEHQAAGRIDEKVAAQVADIVAHKTNPTIAG